MIIKHDILGWRIEPSTDVENKYLEFLINALQNKYETPIVIEDAETTNHLQPLVPIPNMVF